jgi:hypothetical protein
MRVSPVSLLAIWFLLEKWVLRWILVLPASLLQRLFFLPASSSCVYAASDLVFTSANTPKGKMVSR